MEKKREVAHVLAQAYGPLSKEAEAQLASMLVEQRTLKGRFLLEKGQVCQHIYYVGQGMLRQVYDKGGRQVTEHIAYEGGMIMCIESLFRREPSAIAIEALEPSVTYGIPYEDFCLLTRRSYEYCAFLIRIFQESLIISQQKADTLRFETAKERYLRTLKDHPGIIRRAPLNMVASYLQMTPETLSRVRTKISEGDK